ncbi:MAG: cell division protein FtsZ [Epsilonproteobacteria bacterium]|nr:cell division protein FtsZ [Campylobacterota bacterium]NPA56551.1 cell division protein FtsZ [Campylobacterota bacterium]
MQEPFNIEEVSKITGANIKAVGVGGGGGNMIAHMINEGIEGIELIVANTDSQALATSKAHTKIQLGEKLTRGLGAGMQPEIGREAALESYDLIKEKLDGADIVFISAGMGGGTGTGAAPVIAQAAKEVGALTISVVTRPFKFEGRKRAKLAEEGIEELKKESDSIVVIPNDKLFSIVDRKLGLKDSFKIVDDILARAVGGISGVILSYGENDINLDFADVKTVMSHRGLALMGVGEATGENSAYEAIKSAIESPLLDNLSINGAMGVLVHFTLHPEYPLIDIGEAMNVVFESADDDAHVIFGTTTNSNMAPDQVKITLIATGFEEAAAAAASGEKEKKTIQIAKPSIKEQAQMRKKVVGFDGNEDVLDIPTFLRQQMD